MSFEPFLEGLPDLSCCITQVDHLLLDLSHIQLVKLSEFIIRVTDWLFLHLAFETLSS